MHNFDSLTLQYFFKENYNFINGAIVQKIQLPSRHEIIFNLRNLSEQKNKKLYVNINPKYPHICFIDEKTSKKRDIKIPKNPPMFCMQLRKYLNGSKIKDFKVIQYERIIELYFDYFDEIGSLTSLCLAIELMGKHSNIILYNSNTKVIIGSIHNISAEKSSIREIYGGIKYIYPPQKQKLDILNTSFSTFYEIAKNDDIKEISNNFYYFTNDVLYEIFKKFDKKEEIFSFMQNLEILNEKNFIVSFWGGKNNVSNAIDEYFSSMMFDEILINKKNKLKKYFQKDLKKIKKSIENFKADEKSIKYKEIGDYIMSNLYNIDKNQKTIEVNSQKIELDENINLMQNAQKYYALYKKSKLEYEYQLDRFNKFKELNDYYESIILNINLSDSFELLDEIEDEIYSIGLIKEKNNEKTKTKIEPINFMNYEIYIGKNNKQNDYLISKIAKDEDLWFHGQNFPSSHVILKVPNNKKEPPKEVLEFCAKLTKENSKAKNSGKTPIIMTKRKNLKKPPNTYLGYVTYKNEIEIVI